MNDIEIREIGTVHYRVVSSANYTLERECAEFCISLIYRMNINGKKG